MVFTIAEAFAQAFQSRFLQIQVHGIRAQVVGIAGFAIQLTQYGFGRTGQGIVANQLEVVAAVADFDAEALFDQAEIFIELAAKAGEAAGVDRFDTEAMDMLGRVQNGPLVAIWH